MSLLVTEDNFKVTILNYLIDTTQQMLKKRFVGKQTNNDNFSILNINTKHNDYNIKRRIN